MTGLLKRVFWFGALWAGVAALLWGGDLEYVTLDRMYVKAEAPLRAVQGRGMVKVLLYHAYPTPLRHFRLIAKSDTFDVAVEPSEREEFKPTLIESFTLCLTVKGQPKGDRATVSLGMAADELRSDKQFVLTVPLTKRAEEEINEALAIHAGEIEVYVRRFGDEIYYLYVIPTALLLGWLVWRKVHVTKAKAEGL